MTYQIINKNFMSANHNVMNDFSKSSRFTEHLINHNTLLQTVTGIAKCDGYFIEKCDRSSLQNASGFLLKNATVIIKWGFYYKLRQYTHLLIQLNSLINVL